MSDATACSHDEILVGKTWDGHVASCQRCDRSETGSSAIAAIAAVADIVGWEVPVRYRFENGLWIRRK